MIKNYRNLLRILTGAAVLCAGSASAASFVDQFSQPEAPDNQFINRADVFGSEDMSAFSESTGPFDSILGGFRDIQLSVTPGAMAGSQAGAATEVFNEMLLFSNDRDVESELVLTYDGNDNSADVDLMGLGAEGANDLTNGGEASGLSLEIMAADNPFTVTAGIYSKDGSLQTVTREFTERIDDEGASTMLFFDYEEFAGIDVTDAGAVQFTINASEDLDLTLGPVTYIEEVAQAEVPEPTSLLALAGVGAVGAACGRRKSQKN